MAQRRSELPQASAQYASFWHTTVLLCVAVLVLTTTLFTSSFESFPRNREFSLSLSSFPVKQSDQEPIVMADAALVVDPRSGVVLFEKNADLKLSPVSTTKMVAAVVALENENESQVIEVPDIKVEPQIMKLIPGERLTLRDLLYGMLVWSANDAAEVIAYSYPGGRDSFIAAMNRKAREFGMESTHFLNPSGLPEPGHFSTARDLARFASVAMNNSEFAHIVQTPQITVASIDGKISHKLVNLNQLLTTVPGVLGVKTGWSEETGGALVVYVEREKNPLVVVVLGSPDRFVDSKELIEWAYTTYSWHTISRNTFH